jgi:putative flippase GtrA
MRRFGILRVIYSRFERFIKFAIVGGFCTLTNWTILYVMTEFCHVWYIASSILGMVITTSAGYFLNNWWAFRKDNNRSLFWGWLKYNGTVGVSNLVYLGLLALLTEKAHIWYMFSAFISVFCSMMVTFLTIRKWIWARNRGGVSF